MTIKDFQTFDLFGGGGALSKHFLFLRLMQVELYIGLYGQGTSNIYILVVSKRQKIQREGLLSFNVPSNKYNIKCLKTKLRHK